MSTARKHYSAPEKVSILRLHLLEKKPVSDLCDQYDIHPTLFYRWQKEFFENGAAAFENAGKRRKGSRDNVCEDPILELRYSDELRGSAIASKRIDVAAVS